MHLTCQSCVDDVQCALAQVDEIDTVDVDLARQLVTVNGVAPPSAIQAAIQATGRDAILRGSGDAGAAVCILECFTASPTRQVGGLVRLVQVAPRLTVVDLTLHGLPAGRYWATVRGAGDISQGAISTGAIWQGDDDDDDNSNDHSGNWGILTVHNDGRGGLFLERRMAVANLIGRSIVVSDQHAGVAGYAVNNATTLVGVIARSAGVWDNDKTVCSCSGQTLWDERAVSVAKGHV